MKKITITVLLLGLFQISVGQSYKNFSCSTLLAPETNDCSVSNVNTTIDEANKIIEIKSAVRSASEFNLNFLFADGDNKNMRVPKTALKDDILTLSNAGGFSITGLRTRTSGKDENGNEIFVSYGDYCSHTGAKVVTTFSFTAFADDNTLNEATATININPNNALGDATKFLSSTWTIKVVYDESLSFENLDYYDFTFSPNPASNSLNLKANEKISNVELYNSLGQKVLSRHINALDSNLDISRLNKGIYIMKATIGDKTGSYRIIKD